MDGRDVDVEASELPESQGVYYFTKQQYQCTV